MFGANQEWRVQNSLRSYPFIHEGDLISRNTGIKLSSDLIADLLIVAQTESIVPKISSIHVTPYILTVLFYDELTGLDLGVARYTLGSQTYRESIQSVGSIDVSGWVSFGTCASVVDIPTGRHEFRETNHSIEARCVMATGPAPITSIRSEYGPELDGLVEFLTNGGFNFDVSYQIIDGEKITYLMVGLSDPSRFLGDCTPANTVCECDTPPIGRINTVLPDISGNILITADSPIILEKFIADISLSFQRTSDDVCVKPPVPSSTGVLPGETE